MDAWLTTAIATDGCTARSALTPGEARQCAVLSSPCLRRDFRAGRLAAKRAAGAVLDRHAPQRIEVTARPDGSTCVGVLDDDGRRRPLDRALSLAWRDGHAAAVLGSAGARVGVAVERVGAVSRWAAADLLTPFEREIGDGADPAMVWCVKQAAAKALGLGRPDPPTSVELWAHRSGRLAGIRTRGALLPTHTRLSEPWPGFYVATVWMPGGAA